MLSFEQRKALYLEMLEEIDAFCRSHNIRYSLSSGTLIGALRHRGFIPWDDDLDITMPLPDVIRFRNEFRSENLRFCDIDTCRHYRYPFPRIESLKTYSQVGPFHKSFGLSIDVYVVVGLPDGDEARRAYFEEGKKLFLKRKKLMNLMKKVVRNTPLVTIPGFDASVRAYRDHLCNSSNPYEKSKYFFRIASAMDDKMIARNTLDFDFFDDLVEVDFEGRKFLATGHADAYLSQRYGDYMTPPPEDQRVPYHGGDYFWK